MMNIDELAMQVFHDTGFDINTPLYYYDLPQFACALIAEYEAAGSKPVEKRFNCWSTNEGDSWYEHPADAQLLEDVLGNEPKVGDEFEVMAGWHCVQAKYKIVSQDGDDFEVECLSHPFDTSPSRPDPRVAELEQENARLKEITIPVNIDYGDGAEEVAYGNKHQAARLKKWLDKYFSQKGQLALAQADNQRLREFAQKISEQIPEKPDYWSSCGQCSNNADEAEDLIAQSQDVSALEAIVQKAGEVMRERCNRSSVDRIQYLPGVTLGDLR